MLSETGSRLGGFLYTFDPLRIHTSTFYHLSYLLAEGFGVGGSYVPYQLVHAFLWWARGFLVFLLLSRFLPSYTAVSYVAGALVIVHASDGALQWVGQMNQLGFIFWMLLAWYLLTLSYEAARPARALMLTTVACLAEYMSLWSYESQILLMLAFPLTLPILSMPRWRRLVLISIAWYAVPVVYLAMTFLRYSTGGGTTYQLSVLRTVWRPSVLAGDWLFNIAASLEFWTWTRGEAPTTPYLVGLSLCAVAVFCAGGFIVMRLAGLNERSDVVPPPTNGWTLLACGTIAVILSFPVYLLLGSARDLWRTQFLSGVGSAVVLTALFGIAVAYMAPEHRSVRNALFLSLGGIVVYCGALAALQRGAFNRSLWEHHREAIARVLKTAPNVRPNTIIAFVNVPKGDDPFRHDMWFDVSLRLAYPGTPVSAIYFYPDRTPAPGDNLRVESGRWKWDGTAYPPLVRDTSIANTIVIDFAASGKDALVAAIPPYICSEPCAPQLYNPSVLIAGTISPRAVRRYRLSSPSSDVN